MTHHHAGQPRQPHRGEVTPDGWTVWCYRGAEIHTQGSQTALHLPGHPYDGRSGFDFDLALRMVDAWCDSPAQQPPLGDPKTGS
jgi:hypothetical protein